MASPSYLEVAKMLDHSLLNPALTEAELVGGCAVAKEYNAASVCVLPYFLPRVVGLLAGTTVVPSTTIGFPHGGHTTATKVAEAKEMLAAGAIELDMVVNISRVRSHDWQYVQVEIQAIEDVAKAHGAYVKVIFENAYLNDAEKIKLCGICAEVNVAWVKTSTGYAPAGATEPDVKLMREHSPPHIQVKAAGGVRTLDAVLRMRELGCTRVGASATKAIMEDYRHRFGVE